ncbi:MAG: hypothetical protein ABI777_10065, partial [Betaproteobacteria bacterium]
MKKIKNALLIGVLAAMLPLGVQTAQAATATTNVANPLGASTAIDWVIDLAVNMKSAQLKLTNADRLVLREQMQIQFRSLSSEKQREIIASTNGITAEEGVANVTRALNAAVRAQAEQALAEMQASASKPEQRTQREGSTKLGLTGTDLIFVPTQGPCRVADTRLGLNAAWPGPVDGFGVRQMWAYSSFGGYNYAGEQGGTGTAGSGNCSGTVYGGATRPASVVVTLTVIDTSTGGALRAWDGTPALTVGGVLAWNAGDRLSNTTVVPMNRNGVIYPGSVPNEKRDIAVNNNSPTPINVVADVIGYFIANQATALDCTTVSGTPVSIGSGASLLVASPSCPVGYTYISPAPVTNVFGLYTGSLTVLGCRLSNTTGGSLNGQCDSVCCRV